MAANHRPSCPPPSRPYNPYEVCGEWGSRARSLYVNDFLAQHEVHCGTRLVDGVLEPCAIWRSWANGWGPDVEGAKVNTYGLDGRSECVERDAEIYIPQLDAVPEPAGVVTLALAILVLTVFARGKRNSPRARCPGG